MYTYRQNGAYERSQITPSYGHTSQINGTSTETGDAPHINMNVLGPGYWDVIHRITINVSSAQDRLRAVMFTKFIIDNFPCVDPCRKHIQEYEKLYPLKDVLPAEKDESGRDLSLFKWWFRLHNIVNERKGKPLMEWNDAIALYSKEATCSLVCTKGTTTKEETKDDEAQYLSAI